LALVVLGDQLSVLQAVAIVVVTGSVVIEIYWSKLAALALRRKKQA